METGFTRKGFLPSEKTPAQEKLAVGLRLEDIAVEHYSDAGFALVARNFWIGNVEVDCVFYDRDKKICVLVEVRARSSAERLPRHFLTRKKIRGLERAAQILARSSSTRVRIELFEIVRLEDGRCRYSVIPF